MASRDTLEIAARSEKDKNIALHRWLMFLDEKLPDMDPIIELTEEQLEEMSNDEYMLQLTESRAKAQSDWVSGMEGSMAAGIAIGKAEGKSEGKAEGKKEVITIGLFKR